MYCFFTGHRDAPDSLQGPLYEAVCLHAVRHGVTEFVVGNHGSFDFLAAQAVRRAKQQHPHIRLTLLLSRHPAEYAQELPEGFDQSLYPSGLEQTPKRFALVRANRRMVELSGFLIAYVRHPASNAQKLLEYAALRESRGLLKITRL